MSLFTDMTVSVIFIVVLGFIVNYLIDKFKLDNRKKDQCEWVYTEAPEFQYLTGCGTKYRFLAGDVQDNNFNVCPFCGREIKEYV